MEQTTQRTVKSEKQLLAEAVWAKHPSKRTEKEWRLLEEVARAKRPSERTNEEDQLLDDVDGPWHD
jgi:hypothetical protein